MAQRFVVSEKAPEGDESPPEQFEFTLGGTLRKPTADGKQDWEETFEVLSEPPPGAMSDLAIAARYVPETESIVYNRAAVLRFIRGTLVPEQEARWDELMRDKNRICRVDRLTDVLMWITDEVFNRPTGPQSSSTDGLRTTNNGSEGSSSSPDTPVTT